MPENEDSTERTRRVQYCRDCDGQNIHKRERRYVCGDCGRQFRGVSIRYMGKEQ